MSGYKVLTMFDPESRNSLRKRSVVHFIDSFSTASTGLPAFARWR